MAFFYCFVIWRAQNLLPLIYLNIFLEYASRIAVGQLRPLKLEETAPG
jgi:hypothetical protein